MTAAYQTGKYRNVFLECGYSKEEIQERVEKTGFLAKRGKRSKKSICSGHRGDCKE